MRVSVVTDSSSGLPADLAARWGVTVVPVQIRLRGRLDDETRVPRQVVLDALRSGEPVSTEPPHPAALYWAYQAAAAAGADAVVSVHLSARQSQTYEHARQAAAQIRLPVHVVDSRTTGMPLGYAAIAAGRVANAGGDPRRVVEALGRRLDGSSALIYVDTLEHLRRGGRIGKAASLIGAALSVKPILTIAEGEVAPLDKALGSARALRRLADIAVDRAGGRPVNVAVEHVGARERAEAVLADLRPRLPQLRETLITDYSTALAVHLGPGAVGVAIAPA